MSSPPKAQNVHAGETHLFYSGLICNCCPNIVFEEEDNEEDDDEEDNEEDEDDDEEDNDEDDVSDCK